MGVGATRWTTCPRIQASTTVALRYTDRRYLLRQSMVCAAPQEPKRRPSQRRCSSRSGVETCQVRLSSSPPVGRTAYSFRSSIPTKSGQTQRDTRRPCDGNVPLRLRQHHPLRRKWAASMAKGPTGCRPGNLVGITARDSALQQALLAGIQTTTQAQRIKSPRWSTH